METYVLIFINSFIINMILGIKYMNISNNNNLYNITFYEFITLFFISIFISLLIVTIFSVVL